MTEFINGNKILANKPNNLWKFFLIIFVISFFILNWSDISWVFNYKIYSSRVRNLVAVSEKKQSFYDKDNSIEIEKIDIIAPIVIPEGSSDKDFDKARKKGVAHFPGSPFPGERGLSILLGHSAPAGYPKIDYDWIFSRINDLDKGDMITVYFNKAKHTYKVTDKIFLEVGEQVKPQSETGNYSEIILLSCWPPGRNTQRIGIRGVLMN